MRVPRLQPVDPHDDAATAAWFSTYRSADVHERPHAAPFQLEEIRAGLQAEPLSRWRQAWSLTLAGEVATTGLVELPSWTTRTSPTCRSTPIRARVGAGWAAPCSRGWRPWPPTEGGRCSTRRRPGPTTCRTARRLRGGSSCSPAASRWAWSTSSASSLPAPPERLAALATESAPHHRGYQLRAWAGSCSDDLVAGVAALEALVAVEAPIGDLELGPDTADVAAYRRREELLAAQGRTRLTAAALDERGEVVAYSDLVVPRHEPGRAYQWGTLVRRDHRGHRLGLAVKLATLELLQRDFPERTRLTTWNAEVNAPMVAVNDRLGFRPVERTGQFQKRL
ncbi:MAG: hypothetical protein R2731_15255 [Nocardioides sp.]